MAVKLIPLGLGGWISHPVLGYSSILVKGSREGLLLDAGEGAYQRLVQCGMDVEGVTHVYITHAHGDHLLGLPTLALMAKRRGHRMTLLLWKGLSDKVKTLFSAIDMPQLLDYVDVVEFDDIVRTEEFELRAMAVKHSAESRAVRISHLGTGKCIAYSGDTSPVESLVELARRCDLLIHEASANWWNATEAHAHGHSTVEDAVEVAARAEVGALMPIHFYVYSPFLREIGRGVSIVLPLPCTPIEI